MGSPTVEAGRGVDLVRTRGVLRVVGVLLGASIGGCQSPQPEFVTTFNGVEAAVVEGTGRDLQYRAYTNFGYKLDRWRVMYHGFNQVRGLDGNTYQGLQRIGVGTADGRVEGVVRMTTRGHDGVVDTKFGVRTNYLHSLVGARGYVAVASDPDAGSVTLLFRKPIAGDLSAEVFSLSERTYGDGTRHNSELQLNYEFMDHLLAFVRLQAFDGEFEDGTYLLGIRVEE